MVRAAIAAGAKTPDRVYVSCGVERKCGRCQETIASMVENGRHKDPLVKAA
ncbi:MAG: hypothetical protein KGJ79_12595 [Alphaproteobacteria bacterium]|nr:hypothetical protein [Alphaproteobacteria bacterium]MDE2492539.1 hypothetical protein [Alphaproteobacteria bacterium]